MDDSIVDLLTKDEKEMNESEKQQKSIKMKKLKNSSYFQRFIAMLKQWKNAKNQKPAVEIDFDKILHDELVTNYGNFINIYQPHIEKHLAQLTKDAATNNKKSDPVSMEKVNGINKLITYLNKIKLGINKIKNDDYSEIEQFLKLVNNYENYIKITELSFLNEANDINELLDDRNYKKQAGELYNEINNYDDNLSTITQITSKNETDRTNQEKTKLLILQKDNVRIVKQIESKFDKLTANTNQRVNSENYLDVDKIIKKEQEFINKLKLFAKYAQENAPLKKKEEEEAAIRKKAEEEEKKEKEAEEKRNKEKKEKEAEEKRNKEKKEKEAEEKFLQGIKSEINKITENPLGNSTTLPELINNGASNAISKLEKINERFTDDSKITNEIKQIIQDAKGLIEKKRKEVVTLYIQEKIAKISQDVDTRFNTNNTINDLENEETKVIEELEQLKEIGITETDDNINNKIEEIKTLKGKHIKRLQDANNSAEGIIQLFVSTNTEIPPSQITQYALAEIGKINNIPRLSDEIKQINVEKIESFKKEHIENYVKKKTNAILANVDETNEDVGIATTAITLLQELKEEVNDNYTLKNEIKNKIKEIENKIKEIEAKKTKENEATKTKENKLLEIEKKIQSTKTIIEENKKQGYEILTLITTLKDDVQEIEGIEEKTKFDFFTSIDDIDKLLITKSKDALIENAKLVIKQALTDKKTKKIDEKANELIVLEKKEEESISKRLTYVDNINKKNIEQTQKTYELNKAQQELIKATKELASASIAASTVNADAKAKVDAKADAKAAAKAKVDADAEKKVKKYIAAREEHNKETDKKKLIDATSNYDKFITDINKRLDHIIFLCNQFDFERINMLLKKLIVNHDYVAKDINSKARKYSDLNSSDNLIEKMLEKGGYTKMIASMDKNFNLINKKFNEFWDEYNKKIKNFHEKSMSDDIFDINSKIAEILNKLKKLRYDDGMEQDTVPLDFSLIADNAIIYKMNFYNFFKKIIENLHIIQESIPEDANYEEIIAEQRKYFDSKFYTMYESLYYYFKYNLDASLKQIEIIKGRSKNNLSAIINKLEQSVINDPKNIAGAMSYVDDLFTEIPEEIGLGENDDEPAKLIATEQSTIKNVLTLTDQISKLENELKQIEGGLQNFAELLNKEDQSIDDTKIIITQLKNDIQQLKTEQSDDQLTLTDEIMKDENFRLDLMGIHGEKNNTVIENQKKFINNIIDIKIDQDKDTENTKMLEYIERAVNYKNTEPLNGRLFPPEPRLFPPEPRLFPPDPRIFPSKPRLNTSTRQYPSSQAPATPETLPETLQEAPAPEALQETPAATPFNTSKSGPKFQPQAPKKTERQYTSGRINLLNTPTTAQVAQVADTEGATTQVLTAAPHVGAKDGEKHFKYSFEKTSETTKIYEEKGYIYKNGTNDGASFMASLNAGHQNLRVGGGTINGAFNTQIQSNTKKSISIVNDAVSDETTDFIHLSVKMHTSCYMNYYKINDKIDNKPNVDNYDKQNTKLQIIFNEINLKIEKDNRENDDRLFHFENLLNLYKNKFLKEMYLYIPKERLDKSLMFKETHINPGDIFIDILQDNIIGLNDNDANIANKAMIYCAGPNGDEIRNNKNIDDVNTDIIEVFLNAMEQVGKNIANAIYFYNINKKINNLEKEQIDFVRICLISGNAYLPKEMKDKIESPDGSYTFVPNPEYQKQVAMKLIDGIHSANMVNNITDAIVYNFAYAENAFLNAYNEKEIKDKITPFIL